MENPYARMLYWEVENFMSFEYAKVEFDDRGIVNLKGYNDSGKSAVMLALKILLYNCNPQKQVSFIQDDKDYFRVRAVFEDGVVILRDKYMNGQSLYEMYKGNQLLFTTKCGNALTKVSDVPQPIADYLGVLSVDGMYVNARSCFEKQFGVQTMGSENYKVFTTVLKSEELATASEMLNQDRNRLASDITALNSKLEAYKSMYTPGITKDMLDYLKQHDTELESAESCLSALTQILGMQDTINNIGVSPELDVIDLTRLNDLSRISNISHELSDILVYPETTGVDTAQLSLLSDIMRVQNSLDNLPVYPEFGVVDDTQLVVLQAMLSLVDRISECEKHLSDIDENVSAYKSELQDLSARIQNAGVKMVTCPGCGQVFGIDEEHIH